MGTGDKAIVIGGQNVLPFYTFDAEIQNAPKIGVELTDLGMEEYTMPGEKEFYAGCQSVVDMAKRAETERPYARASAFGLQIQFVHDPADKYAGNYRYMVVDNEAGLEYISRDHTFLFPPARRASERRRARG